MIENNTKPPSTFSFKYILWVAIFLISAPKVIAQSQDSLQDILSDTLNEVIIIDNSGESLLEQGYMHNVEGTAIYAAKKTDVIAIDKLIINTARNSGRQIFQNIAGLNIWESDASGLQLDIATRGLDPNRSSNFNLRQNGYDMSADALGYPDAYYMPPMEAVEKIEIVRGAASLQYGTQFGGMMNFKLKEADPIHPFAIELHQSAGSYGFSNTFARIHGTKNKFGYNAYYQYRRGNGWRPNTHFGAHNYYSEISYQVNDKIEIKAEYSLQRYLAQQPGGLTDVQFYADASQSYRSRNWFRVRWNLLALHFDYQISDKLKLNNKTFALLASRDAIGNLSNIQRLDVSESPRDLFKDKYKNIGNEMRLLYRYRTTAMTSFVALLGLRLYHGNTEKFQDIGDSTSSPIFSPRYNTLQEGSQYVFPSNNISIFGEHLFAIGKWSIAPGFRYEFIQTIAEGRYKDIYTFNDIVLRDSTLYEKRNNSRHIILAGIGVSYKPNAKFEFFANISQNYRAVNFNDIRTRIPGQRVDPNISDEHGMSADIGLRGTVKQRITYNTGLYYLLYKDRISEVNLKDTLTLISYRYRTNIAKSRTIGLDLSIQIELLPRKWIDKDMSLQWSQNISWLDARYMASLEPSIVGKKLEFAPQYICRSNLSYSYKGWSIGSSVTSVSKQYTDATNATMPTANAIAGPIPKYYVLDFSLGYSHAWISAKFNINNLSNNLYFTRRATGYPGPGIIPAEPITFYGTIIFKWVR